MTSVALTTVKLVAAVVRKATEVAPVRSVPVIVTWVPPASGPAVGEMAVTVGGGEAPMATGLRTNKASTVPSTPTRPAQRILRICPSLESRG